MEEETVSKGLNNKWDWPTKIYNQEELSTRVIIKPINVELKEAIKQKKLVK